MTKVLLYSGGMDSWLIDKLWKPDVKLYIDINGMYSKEEKQRLPADVTILRFPLLGTFEQADRYIPMRNLYFLMLASHYGNCVCLGATAGDGGKDKSLKFLQSAETLMADLWDDKKVSKPVALEKRFVAMSKTELVQEYLKQGGTLEEIKQGSFSCYSPINNQECFDCYPCFRKFAVLYSLGCPYTKRERKKIWEYVKRQIIPTKQEGGYGGTYYTDRGQESISLIKAVQLLRDEFEGRK